MQKVIFSTKNTINCMRKIIRPIPQLIEVKKKVRVELCINCKTRYGVDPSNDIHWRGFCGYKCSKGFRPTNFINVNEYDKPIKAKDKNKKKCLFCLKKIEKTGKLSRKKFCDDDCKRGFETQRSNSILNLEKKGVLRKLEFSDGVTTQVFSNHFWLKKRYETFVSLGNKCQKCSISAKEKVIDIYPKSLTTTDLSDSKSYSILCDDCSKFTIPLEVRLLVFQKESKSIVCPVVSRASGSGFYNTNEWKKLRYIVLTKYNNKCLCCGRLGSESEIHVDHIKPRSKFSELESSVDNLQTLCKRCNIGKSNVDDTDWRE
jgi:5-methylcytosine-specific restriction endonuclease McrA